MGTRRREAADATGVAHATEEHDKHMQPNAEAASLCVNDGETVTPESLV